MKLYEVKNVTNNAYDTYDGMIVIAKDEEEARWINPSSGAFYQEKNFEKNFYSNTLADWAHPTELKVKFIADVVGKTEPELLLSSFNSG